MMNVMRWMDGWMDVWGMEGKEAYEHKTFLADGWRRLQKSVGKRKERKKKREEKKEEKEKKMAEKKNKKNKNKNGAQTKTKNFFDNIETFLYM